MFAAGVAAFVSLSGVAGTAPHPWADKDWTKWSGWDCERTLNYSPWTCLKDLGSCETGTSVYRQSDYWSLVRFDSALPVRQAQLRKIQLEKHYDSMKPEKKKAFDEEHASEITEGDGDRVVMMWVNHAPYMEFDGRQHDASFPARQASLVLSDGRLVMPIQTTVSGYVVGSTAKYVFPRTIDGKPLYSETDKEIVIQFGEVLPYDGHGKDRIFGPQKESEFHRYGDPDYRFQISKLMYKGNVEY